MIDRYLLAVFALGVLLAPVGLARGPVALSLLLIAAGLALGPATVSLFETLDVVAPGSGAESLTWVTTAEAGGTAARLRRRGPRGAPRRHLGAVRVRVPAPRRPCRGCPGASRAGTASPPDSPASWRSQYDPAHDEVSASISSVARSRTSTRTQIRERLLADGHEEARRRRRVAVINSCCVTNEAVAKSRKAAARAARTHERVYVTGLRGEPRRDGFAGLPANVVVVARRAEETAAFVAGDVGAIGCVQADARLDRVRAFVKIQDGCSFSCGFCVIPLVRGASRSRRADAVLGEIRRRVEQGHREVVLTGINLGCFRDRDAGVRPAAPRARRPARRPASTGCGSARSRSTTSTTELVAALRETPTVARHLHVPLQSGDDGVLRAMGRRYSDRDLSTAARAARRRVQPDDAT